MQRFALALTLGCSAPMTLVAQAPGTSVGTFLRPLMPAGIVQAEVLQMWAPPRLTMLSTKLQDAAKADPGWWRAHVASATPGQPLPYDTRMGLTEGEYREFLTMTDSVVMRPSGEASIQIEETSAGWRVGAETTIPELRGIELDTIADLARTSFGTLNTRSSVSPSEAQRATGRWAGIQWRREEVSPDGRTGISARLAVGRLEASGQTLLFLEGKRIEDGRATPRSMTVVRWQSR
jgi:hypothetical protein